MKQKSFLWASLNFLLLILFAAACQPKEGSEPEEITLSLSTNTLMMDNKLQAPSAPQVTITTNSKKVKVTTQSEWLTAALKDNGIYLAADENKLGRERKADVLIFAEGQMEVLTVTQSAADLVLEVSPEVLTVQNSGVHLLVSVKSNSGDWKVEPSEYEWMEVEKYTSELVKIVVKPNKDAESRKGYISTKLEGVEKLIEINQLGVGTEKFMLPFLSRKDEPYKRMKYETDQGSFQYSDRFNITEPNSDIIQTYIFALSSTVFEETIYIYLNGALDLIWMTAPDGSALASQEYKDFLMENGFEIEGEEEGSFYGKHKELPFSFEVVVNELPDESSVRFYPEAMQDKEYPTFQSFPFDKSGYINNKQWNVDKIVKEEEAEGREVEVSMSDDFPDLVEGLLCTLEGAAREVPFIRYYLFNINEEEETSDGTVRRLLSVWQDVTLGFYEDQGKYYMTKEFRALLKNNGFVKWNDPESDLYINESKGLVIRPSAINLNDDYYLSILYVALSEEELSFFKAPAPVSMAKKIEMIMANH